MGKWWLAGGVAPQNCVAAYQPVGAASLAGSYVNLAQPGVHDAAPGTAPTWAASTGWTFNGTTQYLTTGITPAGGQAWSAVVRYSGVVVGGTYQTPFGAHNGVAPYFAIELGTTGDNFIYYESGAYAGKVTVPTAAVIGFAGDRAYRNGIDEGIAIPASAGSIGQPAYIGAYNKAGAATVFFAGNILAIALYSTVLSAAQVLAITTAMNALAPQPFSDKLGYPFGYGPQWGGRRRHGRSM